MYIYMPTVPPEIYLFAAHFIMYALGLFQKLPTYPLLKSVKTIQNGSMLTWQHVNMRGEYDFTKSANSTNFDMHKILALKMEEVG